MTFLGRNVGLPSGEAMGRGGMGSLFIGLLLLLSSISVLIGIFLLLVLVGSRILEEWGEEGEVTRSKSTVLGSEI